MVADNGLGRIVFQHPASMTFNNSWRSTVRGIESPAIVGNMARSVSFSMKTSGLVPPAGSAVNSVTHYWLNSNVSQTQVIVATGRSKTSGTDMPNQAFNVILRADTGPGCIGVMGYFNDYYPVTCPQPVYDRQWHKVDVTYDGASNLSIFTDGRIQSSACVRPYNTNGSDVLVGTSNDFAVTSIRPFVGEVKDLVIKSVDKGFEPTSASTADGKL